MNDPRPTPPTLSGNATTPLTLTPSRYDVLKEQRNAIIEECAVVAEQCHGDTLDWTFAPTRSRIAAAIRALKEGP